MYGWNGLHRVIFVDILAYMDIFTLVKCLGVNIAARRMILDHFHHIHTITIPINLKVEKDEKRSAGEMEREHAIINQLILPSLHHLVHITMKESTDSSASTMFGSRAHDNLHVLLPSLYPALIRNAPSLQSITLHYRI